MFGFIGRNLLATGAVAAVASVLAGGQALAAPCTSTLTATGGIGSFTAAQMEVAGVCVVAQDKTFSGFTFDANTIAALNTVDFNLLTFGTIDRHSIAFNGNYVNGNSYNIGFEVAINGTAVPNTIITELDGDFTQTFGGPSELKKNSTPTGTPATGIDIIKNADVASGPNKISYLPGGQTDLVISETLTDNGTISSINDTVVEAVGGQIPEPASLGVIGVALAGLGLVRRRRR